VQAGLLVGQGHVGVHVGDLPLHEGIDVVGAAVLAAGDHPLVDALGLLVLAEVVVGQRQVQAASV
jgi:hypothetical protein